MSRTFGIYVRRAAGILWCDRCRREPALLGSAGKIRGAWSCRRRTGARSLGADAHRALAEGYLFAARGEDLPVRLLGRLTVDTEGGNHAE